MQYRLAEPAVDNTRGRLFACVLCLLLNVAACPARADINLLAPSRTIDPTQPLRLSLLVTGEADSRDYILPAVLVVSLTPDLGAAATVELRRATSVPDQITLRAGEFMRIDYVGTVPTRLRGRVRIDAVDIDAPAMLVQLSTPATRPEPGCRRSATTQAWRKMIRPNRLRPPSSRPCACAPTMTRIGRWMAA